MRIGLDNGYNAAKLVSDGRRAIFPSVVGTPTTRQIFAVNGQEEEIKITTAGQTWLVGDGAVNQSRFLVRREDRDWINSDEYYVIALAGISEMTAASGVDVKLVTGLPVAYYSDNASLKKRLMGEHRFQRAGRNTQTVKVSDVRVVPQPFGALLSEALDNRGGLANQEYAGRVGVIDVGGKTTNFLSANKLAEVPNETASINIGGWDIIRQLRDYLAETVPGLEMRDHELATVLKDRSVRVAGEMVLLPGLTDIIEPMGDQVLATARQLWGSALKLDSILIAGGGAHLIGPHLQIRFKQSQILDNPVYANATGFWKLAQRLG